MGIIRLIDLFDIYISLLESKTDYVALQIELLTIFLNIFINLTNEKFSTKFLSSERSKCLTDAIFRTLIISKQKLLFNTKAEIDRKCFSIIVNIIVSDSIDCYQTILLPIIQEIQLDGLKLFLEQFNASLQTFTESSDQLNLKSNALNSNDLLLHKRINLEKNIEFKTKEHLCVIHSLCYLSVIIASLAYHKNYLIKKIKLSLDNDRLLSMEGFLYLFQATLENEAHSSLIGNLSDFFKNN